MATTLSYRIATRRDVNHIAALIECAYRSELASTAWTTEAHLVGGERTSAKEILEIVEDRHSCFLLGILDGAILSCCQLSRREDGHVYFGMFCVHPTEQGKGMGSELLREAEHTTRSRFHANRLELWLISGRDELARWYERRGFVATDERVPFHVAADERRALVAGLEFLVFEKQLLDTDVTG